MGPSLPPARLLGTWASAGDDRGRPCWVPGAGRSVRAEAASRPPPLSWALGSVCCTRDGARRGSEGGCSGQQPSGKGAGVLCPIAVTC